MADKFLDFIDMIDGGGYGEGKMGDKFEGGGIFSMLANALATPYGSEDDERMRRLRQRRGLLDMDEDMAPVPAATPATRSGGTGRTQVRPQARPVQSMPNPQSGIPLPIGRPNPQGGMPMPLGKPSPQMGIPMPAAALAALRGPSLQAGMPIAMTDDDAFRIMVSQLGQTAVDRMSGQQFVQTLNQIKSQGRGM